MDVKTIKKIKQFFTALSDDTRLKILLELIKGPKNVNDIHKLIPDITLSAVSHQLRQMNDIDIVLYEKKGREKIYSLSENFCWCILRDAVIHFKEGSKNCHHCIEMLKEHKQKKRGAKDG
ncbi:winged helix-turn-helix transcriptional regulator [Candidatus Woesearchaeota archaeon]|nr:winged helix-turn-helix transcriptional regulator [Candidatus Woesearchaeota archaeon]